MTRPCLALFSAGVLLATALAGAETEIDLLWGVKVPMRDGVKLNATVYKPKKMDAPLPIVFTLTPYISDSYHPRAKYFSENGYVFVLMDVRGRGSSEGRFEPMLQEAKDGHDVVEWLARQPWSNGKVAMWGGSYAGYNQWATAKEFPPHLKTIVPAASAFAGVDFPFAKNIFYPYEMQWQTFTSGATGNGNLFGEQSFWIQKYRELYLSHGAFRSLDEVVGNPSPVFQRWVAHPEQGAFWDAYNPTDAEFARLDLPILTITGHYDGDQAGAMEFYRRHMKHASPAARERHYLLIGPWDHAGTRTPKKEFAGLDFGEKSVLNLNDLHRQWYDWTLKDGKKPDFLKKRVAYYVAGAGEWRYADSLEAAAPSKRTLYLDSTGGRANDVFQSGTLSDRKPGRSEPDKYTYDPLDTRPAELERKEVEAYITDQSYALNLFGSGLVYHSAPFDRDTEITGYVRLSAWISMDVPDTDIAATLSEILPDGKSIALTQDQVRARYRESLRKAVLVRPGEVAQYDFDGFTFFSRRVGKGSRLRLVLRAPNSIYTQKNYNSGGIVSEETGKDARTAHVTLYHDSGRPSSLELPIAN